MAAEAALTLTLRGGVSLLASAGKAPPSTVTLHRLGAAFRCAC